MSETRPSHPDHLTAPEDGWFHPTPPEDHVAARGAPTPEAEPAVPEPKPTPTPAISPRGRRETAIELAADAVSVVSVLALFGLAAAIVPTLTDVATSGDWIYARSVETLLDDGGLKVYPQIAETAVGQILWGALFGAVFDTSLGVLRLSTVAMSALGGVALYAILRQLGVSRGRGALGMAIWLFNPLTFSLALTFLPDASFASAMLIAVALNVRGLRPGREDARWVAAGSVVAALAFLIRPQGALIPLAVGICLVLSGRLQRGDIRRLHAVVAVPALTVVAHVAWLRWRGDVPPVHEGLLDAARAAGRAEIWLLVRRIPVYAAFYGGLILVPILAAIAPWRRRGGAPRPVSGFMACLGLGWAVCILTALYLAGRRGQEMPFAPDVVSLAGLGRLDVPGGRPPLVEVGSWATTALTVAAAAGAIAFGGIIIRALGGPRTPERAGFWLVATVGVGQLAGILPPSLDVIDQGVTLDRYLLPVIPIAIVAALWALRDIDLVQPVSWMLLAVVAAVSIAGARDSLVMLDRAWAMARYANDGGVDNDRLDAGSAWNGYHLAADRLDEGIAGARPPGDEPGPTRRVRKPIDADYIVATRPDFRFGYVVAASDGFDLWLDDDPGRVYLLRRWYLPFPVIPAGTGEAVWPIAGAPPRTGLVPSRATQAAATPAIAIPGQEAP